MKIIPFENLYNTEFLISEPMAKVQYWRQRGNLYSAIGKPKSSHTLLWFKNCEGRITDKSGKVLEIAQNQVAYMAKGTEYRVEFLNNQGDSYDTLVIHFQMTDMYGEEISAVQRPIICIKNAELSQGLLMENLAEEFKNNVVCIPEMKSSIYKLLSDICHNRKRKVRKSKYTCISSGIKLLEQNSDLKIAEIAKLCGVSECYFRRLFIEYSGMSPMDFRQHYRIEKAKQLLLSDEGLTISEIADELNFSDVYHFSKTFKKYSGISPSQFLSGEIK